MLAKAKRRKTRIVVLFIFAVVIILPLIGNIIAPTQIETQTDIEVRAFVGNSAKNKLGGIQFAVSDCDCDCDCGCWGYDGVIFQVPGFEKGLKLGNVICYRDGSEVKHFNQRGADWDIWLERFQEVLVKATTGEKLNTSNTPSSR